MKKYLHLFWTYLKISATTHGGGYAMVGIMERELVETQKMMSGEDYMETVGICQTFPGPLAITSSGFIGYRLAGIGGAISCLLGFLLPSFVIIFIISTILLTFDQNPYVKAAITGIDGVVPMLILLAVVKFAAKLKKNVHNIIVAIIALIALEVFDVNPAVVIIAAAIYGLFVFRFLFRDKGGAK